MDKPQIPQSRRGAGNEGRGVDTYNSYYIGLRSWDSALVIGRADDGWMEGRPVAIPGGVRPGVWYRLHVVVFGCEIGAEAERIDTSQITWAAFHEPSCVSHGKIGLRSVSTGGAWKGISVLPASEADWRAIRAHAAFISEPVYPYREADYARMRDAYFAANHIVSSAMLAYAGPPPEKSAKAVRTPPVSSIDFIRSMTSESPSRQTSRLRQIRLWSKTNSALLKYLMSRKPQFKMPHRFWRRIRYAISDMKGVSANPHRWPTTRLAAQRLRQHMILRVSMD